jgi:plasmid stability protein
MAQLVVRDLDPALICRLEERAAANGISVEEEHRRILEGVLAVPRIDARYDVLKQVLVDDLGSHDE